MTSVRLWKSVEFAKQVPRQLKPVRNVSDVPPHAWHTLGTDLFYWNKIDCLVIRDYFSKYFDCEETSKQFHTCHDQGIRTNLH